jgi:hypothetical protein
MISVCIKNEIIIGCYDFTGSESFDRLPFKVVADHLQ